MPVYAEGRVEHQKRTQTATTLWPFGFVFGVQLGSLEKNYGVTRSVPFCFIETVRHKPFRAALFFYWTELTNKNKPKRLVFVFCVQFGLRQTQALIIIYTINFLVNRVENQNGHKVVAVWVRFGFQLGLRRTQALIIIYTMHLSQWSALRAQSASLTRCRL